MAGKPRFRAVAVTTPVLFCSAAEKKRWVHVEDIGGLLSKSNRCPFLRDCSKSSIGSLVEILYGSRAGKVLGV
jgi:hypothetical protein